MLHLTFDVWPATESYGDLERKNDWELARYGVYHMLISALPSIAPRLDKLRNGTMQAGGSMEHFFAHAIHGSILRYQPLMHWQMPFYDMICQYSVQ